MTLNTKVYVLDPSVGYREVFVVCQRLLAKYDEQNRPVTAQRFEEREGWIGNERGQELPALMDVTYRLGAPLRTPEEQAAHDPDICTLPDSSWYGGDPATLCDGAHRGRPACWLQISFDTAYGAVSKGLRCSELHGRLIVELGDWLDGRGARLKWMNEYSGAVYDGLDGIASLIGDGDQAMAWFDRQVAPVLQHIIAKGGEQR